jgi:hypothetical protein
MKTFLPRLCVFLFMALLGLGLTLPVHGADLVGLLTEQLGVTDDQAAGGAGAIFEYAKGQLGANDFSQIAQVVPNMDTLLDAAPKSETEGLVDQGLSALGADTGSSLGKLAALAGPFSQLGLSPEMVSQYVPIVLDYVKSTGGETTMGLLRSALL